MYFPIPGIYYNYIKAGRTADVIKGFKTGVLVDHRNIQNVGFRNFQVVAMMKYEP